MNGTFRETLRTVREALGASLSRVARHAGFSESHLRSVENGNRTANVEVAEAYDRALGTAGILVDLFIAEQNGDDVRRRAVLELLSTMTGIGVAGPRVLAEILRDNLLSAMGCDDWTEMSLEYGRRFMTESPAAFRSALSGDLMVLGRSIREDNSVEARLAAPRLMTLYGMVTGNAGDVLTASRWYRAARLAADRTNDSQLRQWVRGREAFRRGYEGASPSEVLATASSVDDVEAKLAAAQAYARLDEKKQAEVSLNDARRIHETADHSETTIYAMPSWRMALSSAQVYALLGDVKSCDAELGLVKPPPTVKRWEAQVEVQRAVAFARSGDGRTGLDVAGTIMHGIGEEQRSVVLVEMYKDVKACATKS